jgi:hypothetical protein
VETKNFLITTIQNACEIHGDDQSGIDEHIYESLIGTTAGGNWIVIVCPKDNNHNVNFTAVSNELGEPIHYVLIREDKMYVIARTF